jgi:amino acid adenylation domain-containing protein
MSTYDGTHNKPGPAVHSTPVSTEWSSGAALDQTVARPVHLDVLAQAYERPDEIAVVCGRTRVSYCELVTWADDVANRLKHAGVQPGARIGILVEPGAAMVAAALGVLLSGGAYVPLHLTSPDHNLARVITNARLGALVVSDYTATRVPNGPPAVMVGTGPKDTSRFSALKVSSTPGTQPAYLIYTSGSTGEPKGVVVSHDQLGASTLARREVYPGRPVFLLLSPLAFDSSVAGLWGTLTAGGRLVVAAADEVADPERLLTLVANEDITHLLCVPSLYSTLLDVAERDGTGHLISLQTVIVAGEALHANLVQRHFELHQAGVALVNEYGPTEATVWASYRRFTEPGPVSIGGPIPGAFLYVLDESQRPLGVSQPGELYIGGLGVADGYFEQPAATARAFLPDPFAVIPGARMYKTGDQVSWNKDGTLSFLGRLDQQVKIRGHRIELGAVEEELMTCPGIRNAVVVPTHAADKIVAFVIAVDGFSQENTKLRLPSVFRHRQFPRVL